MVSRDARLAMFDSGPAPEGIAVEVLCEDSSGTYVPPFPCEWRDGSWINPTTGQALQVEVVGWRPANTWQRGNRPLP
jgi:hypothetical protein